MPGMMQIDLEQLALLRKRFKEVLKKVCREGTVAGYVESGGANNQPIFVILNLEGVGFGVRGQGMTTFHLSRNIVEKLVAAGQLERIN